MLNYLEAVVAEPMIAATKKAVDLNANNEGEAYRGNDLRFPENTFFHYKAPII